MLPNQPSVADDMRADAYWAVGIALVCMFLYRYLWSITQATGQAELTVVPASDADALPGADGDWSEALEATLSATVGSSGTITVTAYLPPFGQDWDGTATMSASVVFIMSVT